MGGVTANLEIGHRGMGAARCASLMRRVSCTAPGRCLSSSSSSSRARLWQVRSNSCRGRAGAKAKYVSRPMSDDHASRSAPAATGREPASLISRAEQPRQRFSRLPPSTTMAARRPPTARSIQSAASSDKQPPPPKVVKPPSLARRLLFPHLPPDADLPPLLVSPSATPELNDELYNFIAIALRAYVHPWWTKITRYDKEFLPAITRVLTTVIRVLEARIVKTDLSPLVLRDIPTLINNHYVDYRNAKAKLHTSYAAGGAATLPQLFHQMQPHMAVSAEGTVDEAYIRQALDDVLKICLPPADFEPETERYIIREIMVKVVLGGVIPKVTQPWFIHQTLLNLLGESKDKPLDPEVRIHCTLLLPMPLPANILCRLQIPRQKGWPRPNDLHCNAPNRTASHSNP